MRANGVVKRSAVAFTDAAVSAFGKNTALSFLETNGVTAAEADKSAPTMTAPDIADEAKKYTFQVWCLSE